MLTEEEKQSVEHALFIAYKLIVLVLLVMALIVHSDMFTYIALILSFGMVGTMLVKDFVR